MNEAENQEGGPAAIGIFQSIIENLSVSINKIFHFDETGNLTAGLITIIIVQVAIYACAFSLYGIADDRAAIGLLALYFFCGCFPFLFGPPALISFVRGLQLHKPRIIGLGCIAILLSVGVYIACGASLLGVAVIPEPKPFVKVGSYPIQDVKSYATPGLVLWDLSHGVNYSPKVFHTELMKSLENEGYKFDLNDVGVLNLDISGYSLIILDLGCCASTQTYSSEEASILSEYVNSGGALFLVGEHNELEYSQHLDVVAKRFGLDLSNSPDFDGVYDFDDHPITKGIDSLNFLSGGTISISPPAVGVAWYGNKSSIAVAIAEVGKGRVVVVGDSNFMENLNIGDNEKRFITNAFRWLTQK